MTKSVVVLIPSLHPGNLGLCWLLSFFCRVEARLVHPMCQRFLGGRLTHVQLADYLDAGTIHCFRSKILGWWERLLPHVPVSDWHLRFDHRDLDCSSKAKQELSEAFEDLLLFEEIQRQRQRIGRTVAIDSVRMRYLRRLTGGPAMPYPRTVPLLSSMNSICEVLYVHGATLARAVRLGVVLVHGMLQQWGRRGSALQPGTQCIFDAINPSEMSLSRDDRSAVWIVDGVRVKPQDVLFVIPDGVESKIQQAIRQSSYQVYSMTELLRRMPARHLIRAFTLLMTFLAGYLVRVMGRVPNALAASYTLDMITWKPIIDHLKPYSYVVSFANLGHEHPAILYMNAVGVRTLMYCYAANSYLFASHRCGCDFRGALFSHLLVSRLVVWHEEYKRFLESHPQEQVEICTVGPLMPGDEQVWERKIAELRETYGIRAKDGTPGLRVIAAFDVAAVVPRWQPTTHTTYHLSPYTQEYVTAFLRDLVRLLADREDILLVYKPKRDFSKGMFAPSAACVEAVSALRRHPRAVIVKSTINPWVPMAVADLSIAIPFTSTVLAALHYGRPAIYHDPMNQCRFHRYPTLEGTLLTHSYEAMREKVDELLAGCGAHGMQAGRVPRALRPYVGRDPGASSTKRFQAMILPSVRRPASQRGAWLPGDEAARPETIETPAAV